MAEKALGYILHMRPFRDSSAIIEFFSREHGIVSLLARGAKRARSRLHGLLQPFILLQCSWIGRNDLKTLTAIDTDHFYAQLQEQKVLLGLYLNELLIRLLQGMDPYPNLFDNYHDILSELALSQSSVREQTLLRQFELSFLSELGYGLNLNKDGKTGEPVEQDLVYGYDPTIGFFEIASLNEAQSTLTISGATLIGLRMGEFINPTQLKEAKKMMRFVLTYYLGTKPLQSRKLFLHKGCVCE